MEQLRLFIAVEIPAEVRKRLAEIEQQLMAAGADVKWVPEGNFHITLKFLGNVESDRTDAIAAAVESAVQGVPCFDVTLSGTGAFPNTRRPNVVWVGMTSGADQMKVLAERVERAMEPLGFASENRPFSPHITVGRSKTPKNAENLREQIERQRDEAAGSFQVSNVSVMKSDLRPSGPTYTRISDVRLRI
jgi:2'-5' RNA ligase